jgi:hypothetical protein
VKLDCESKDREPAPSSRRLRDTVGTTFALFFGGLLAVAGVAELFGPGRHGAAEICSSSCVFVLGSLLVIAVVTALRGNDSR